MSHPLVKGLIRLLSDPLARLTTERLARMTVLQLEAVYGKKEESSSFASQPSMTVRRNEGFRWDVPANPSPNAGATIDGQLIDEEPLLWNLVRAGLLKEERVRAVIAQNQAFQERKRKEQAHAS